MATGIWTSPFFEVRPSGASPLPQGVGVYTLFLVSAGQMWGGKPPPTGGWGVHTIFGERRANVGGASPLPQGVGVYTLFLVSTGQMWEGACPRWRRCARHFTRLFL